MNDQAACLTAYRFNTHTHKNKLFEVKESLSYFNYSFVIKMDNAGDSDMEMKYISRYSTRFMQTMSGIRILQCMFVR